MHFLVMSSCSREFLLTSLYIYSNVRNYNVVDYYSSLTYECLVFRYSELTVNLFHRVVNTTSTPIGVEGWGWVATKWCGFQLKNLNGHMASI